MRHATEFHKMNHQEEEEQQQQPHGWQTLGFTSTHFSKTLTKEDLLLRYSTTSNENEKYQL